MPFLKTLVDLFEGFLGLIYPNVCLSCGETLVSGEKYICTNCLVSLPYTHFISTRKNLITEFLRGRIFNLENAYSFLYFYKHSMVQKILYAIKYSGVKELAMELGIYLSENIKDSDYKNADFLVPIPLHYLKLRKRGYNQSEWFARGVSMVLDVPVDTSSIIRTVNTQTQTKKGREERWLNVQNIFEVKNVRKLYGKHIVLIDDVLTTGATIEACADVIRDKVKDVKISVLTLATANKIV